MRKAIIYKISFLVFTLFFSINLSAQSVADTTLSYPFSGVQSGGLFMNTPPNFNSTVVFDPITNKYIVQEKVGGLDFGNPHIMSFSEYQEYAQNKSTKDYWDLRSKARGGNQTSALGLPKLFIPGKAFDRVFGGNAVDIRPQGSAELIFGLKLIESITLHCQKNKEKLHHLIFRRKYK